MICKKCDKELSNSMFYLSKEGYRVHACNDCRKKLSNDRITKLRYNRKANNLCSCGRTPLPGLGYCNVCQKKGLQRYNNLFKNNIEWQNKNNKESKVKRDKLKIEVMLHYGGKCTCCEETHMEFLTIDHIIPVKTLDSKPKHRSGTFLYRWLKRNNYPDGYRVLCLNCNFSLGHYDYCPHKE